MTDLILRNGRLMDPANGFHGVIGDIVMKDGVIQQFDTPQVLYNYPCNKFVAGFVGSPSMNFIECEVAEELGKNPATVSKWCTNVSQPDLYTLDKIATLLDIDKRELITGKD